MFQATRVVILLVGIAIQAQTRATTELNPGFDYVKRTEAGYVEGVIFSENEVACGYTTRAQMSESGYLSVYKRTYWLLGEPHENWNFDVRTLFPQNTQVAVSLAVDGQRFDYPEKITIANGIAGSSSDVCQDGLAGYCPNQPTAKILRTMGDALSSASTLTFIVTSGQQTEQLTMRAHFAAVVDAIDACIGRLLSRTRRMVP